MKKFLFIAVAAAAVTFTSCTNEKAPVAPEPEPEAVELVSEDSLASFIEAADTTAISNFLTEAQAKIEELKNTDPVKAKEYLAKIQALLKENADKIKAFVGTGAVASVIDAVNSLPEIEVPDVTDAAAEAVEGAKDAAAEAVDNAKEAVEGAADAAKDAAADAVDNAKEAVEFGLADAISYVDENKKENVGIEIHSGRNRIVRRIFESLGYKVLKLDRVYFAGLTKKGLRRGDWRFLTEAEVNFLRMGSFE